MQSKQDVFLIRKVLKDSLLLKVKETKFSLNLDD